MITLYAKVDNVGTDEDESYSLKSEGAVRLNNLYSLMHEVAHTLDADDHYCKQDYNDVGRCSNLTCDECYLWQDQTRNCIMGVRDNLEELLSYDTYCMVCLSNMHNHLGNHH